MNTYRVYVLDTTAAEAPVVHTCFVKADKYGPAWQTARAALNGVAGKVISTDVEGKLPFKRHGDELVVAKIDDIRPRNVKLDKAALQAAMSEGTPAEQLAKLAALLA